MNKRKLLTLAMTLCMVAILAIGGTLAYFTDTDSKTNTFTVGNVDIHIDEYMNVDDNPEEWEEYDAAQKLFPIANDDVRTNKIVETVNDGSEDAYIRTFVTCPKDMYNWLGLGFNAGANSKIEKNEKGENQYNVTWKDVGTFKIGGEDTAVFLCEVAGHNKVAKDESVVSLTAVWLYSNVTNEMITGVDLQEGAFNVKVASQAIQADDDMTYEEAMAALGTIDQALMTKLFG